MIFLFLFLFFFFFLPNTCKCSFTIIFILLYYDRIALYRGVVIIISVLCIVCMFEEAI